MIISVVTLLGVLFAIYKFFRDPDVSADKKLSIMEKSCALKHEYLGKDIFNIYAAISDIKNNHLKHIEPDMTQLKIDVAKIQVTSEMILQILKESKKA